MNSRIKIWIILSFIMVFLVGILGGILVEKQFLNKSFSPFPPKDRGKDQPRFPTLESMSEELSLTAEQQEKIKEIFSQSEQRLQEFRKEIHSRLGSLRCQLNEEILAVLNEEQKVKFEAMIQRYLEQRKKEWDKKRKAPSDQRKPQGEIR